MNLGRIWAWRGLAAVGLCLIGYGPVAAADFSEGRAAGTAGPRSATRRIGRPLPRYFPREGDDTAPPRLAQPVRRTVGCVRRRVPIPTDALGDPSYVGSGYGLGKPSYYGFTPPLGVDDPYGRPLLPYCP